MSATPWTGQSPASTNRKNKTSVITDSGTNLTALNKTLYKIVTCNAAGGDFELDHVYYFSDDGATTVDLTELVEHDHGAGSAGGEFLYIQMANPQALELYLSRPTDMIKANWNQTVTGTGTIEDGGGGTSKPYIRLRPNGTSGSGSTISYTNAQSLSFTNPFKFVSSGAFETATSLAFHAGVNCDDVTAADSNTVKSQAEVCTATNTNWWLRTASGSANSASDTGVAISTSDTSISIKHEPWDATVYDYIEIDAANGFTKTTNIATTGNNTTGSILKFSIKNSTGADRPFRMKGCKLSMMTADAWGYE